MPDGIEVTHDPEIPVHLVQLHLCDLCLDGAGGQCHVPGCSLWINRAPDISLRDNPGVTIVSPDIFEAAPSENDAASAPLPQWDELSDLDRGAALLHIHKRDYEGREYAIENYPARYFDHPALTVLNAVAASDHAATLETTALDLEPGEYERLYDLALDADRKR